MSKIAASPGFTAPSWKRVNCIAIALRCPFYDGWNVIRSSLQEKLPLGMQQGTCRHHRPKTNCAANSVPIWSVGIWSVLTLMASVGLLADEWVSPAQAIWCCR